MSDNTRASFLVGSAARGFVFSRTRYCQQSTFAEATVDNLRDRDWLANRSGGAAKVGGARRDRTDDLLLAKQALSQLSYGPFGAPAFAKATAGNLRYGMACRPKPRRGEGWWAWEDLNFRPHAYQARALTN